MDHFLKSLLFLCFGGLFCFFFFLLSFQAPGLLATRSGIKPTLPTLESEVLTIGPPGKSPPLHKFNWLLALIVPTKYFQNNTIIDNYSWLNKVGKGCSKIEGRTEQKKRFRDWFLDMLNLRCLLETQVNISSRQLDIHVLISQNGSNTFESHQLLKTMRLDEITERGSPGAIYCSQVWDMNDEPTKKTKKENPLEASKAKYSILNCRWRKYSKKE